MMNYDISTEKDLEASSKTNEKLDELGLTKTPVNYEVWYAYYAEVMPELNHIIDQFIERKQRITNNTCTELYQEYIHKSEKEQVLLEETGDQIQESLQFMQKVIADAKDNAVNFGGSLKDVSSDLSKADSIEAITKVVKNIVNETKAMLEKNAALEERLEQSSEQVEELKSRLDLIRKESLTDGLTGVANRKSFDEKLNVELDIANKEHAKVCLLMIDIDYFKSFNDNYGHQVGDQVLKLVATTLVNGVKGRDITARYGGEEFSIILPETPLTAAKRVADGLRERIANKEIVNRATGLHLGQITISVGVAEYQHGEEADNLIKRADEALYKAKELGRNRVEIAANPYINLHQNV